MGRNQESSSRKEIKDQYKGLLKFFEKMFFTTIGFEENISHSVYARQVRLIQQLERGLHEAAL